MIRIVLDTNVLISAIAFGGPPREVLNLVIAGKIRNHISDAILDELQDVLQRPKFGYDPGIVRAIVRELELLSEYVHLSGREMHAVTRDPDDYHVLACAITGEAEYLVTGDTGLLSLEGYAGIRIITPAGFLELLRTDT